MSVTYPSATSRIEGAGTRGEQGFMVLDTDGEELVDAHEVAARLGLKSARTVLDLRVHRLGFPAPVGRQGRALLWSWSQVEMWDSTTTGSLPSAFGARVTLD